MPWQGALPYAFEAVLDRNLFDTLPTRFLLHQRKSRLPRDAASSCPPTHLYPLPIQPVIQWRHTSPHKCIGYGTKPPASNRRNTYVRYLSLTAETIFPCQTPTLLTHTSGTRPSDFRLLVMASPHW